MFSVGDYATLTSPSFNPVSYKEIRKHLGDVSTYLDNFPF